LNSIYFLYSLFVTMNFLARLSDTIDVVLILTSY